MEASCEGLLGDRFFHPFFFDGALGELPNKSNVVVPVSMVCFLGVIRGGHDKGNLFYGHSETLHEFPNRRYLLSLALPQALSGERL